MTKNVDQEMSQALKTILYFVAPNKIILYIVDY